MDIVSALLLGFARALLQGISIDLGSFADWFSGLGSVAAVVVALLSLRSVERYRREDRLKAEIALGHEIIGAMLAITESLRNHQRHIAMNPSPVTTPERTYTIFQPALGLSSEGDLNLPTGAIELLVRADGLGVWQDAREAVKFNSIATTTMKEYKELWLALQAKLPAPASSTTFSYNPTDEQMRIFHVEFLRLETITTELRRIVDEGVERAEAAATAVGPKLRAYFGQKFLQLEPLDSEEQSSSAQRS